VPGVSHDLGGEGKPLPRLLPATRIIPGPGTTTGLFTPASSRVSAHNNGIRRAPPTARKIERILGAETPT
jgi:hypothetical protein